MLLAVLCKRQKRVKYFSLLIKHILMVLLIVPKQARELEININLNNTW